MNITEMQEQAVIITALENRIADLETVLGKLRMDYHDDECRLYADPGGACTCGYEWNNGLIDKALAYLKVER